MRSTTLAVLCLLAASPALAQSTYAGASVLGEVTRVGGTETSGLTDFPRGDGEALGFALRVGTSLGDRWGVELEFVRPSAIEDEAQPRVTPLPIPIPRFDFRPTLQYDVRLRQRITSLATVAWLRQYVAQKVDMVYLAGAAFHHVAQETRVEFDPRLVFPVIPALGLGFVVIPSTNTVSYRVGPVVGLEAHIALTEHLTFVPGARLYGMSGGLIVRAGAGAAWSF